MTGLHEDTLGYMLEATQSYVRLPELHEATQGYIWSNICSLEDTQGYNRLHKKVTTIYVTGFVKRYLFHTQNLTHFLKFTTS